VGTSAFDGPAERATPCPKRISAIGKAPRPEGAGYDPIRT
jgi:hypothetical protein